MIIDSLTIWALVAVIVVTVFLLSAAFSAK